MSNKDNETTSGVAASAQTSQAQSASGEQDYKADNKPEKHADEIQFFDTTITKLVERENEDGEMEWVEVLSDNLYPGEKLKRADDEEKAAEKAKVAREARAKAADDRKADDDHK
jgi:hypothetical protein